ncbi:glycosyl hydrolase [Nocardiopsis terrae]|uniref:Glycosyltransferase involved in cell wall biosynthesis n=1 Tax=Nocardiopsis terrae TaxID=372655 RepID=A0ABR9HC89_9ACTN|nr:glycosyltransferase family 4 protein [Nocardiopsis terrae]MBE1456642.1 glycosyltransferase involved in cell wall biosynthesis [Nocardiopsis terrae]GHC75794.1 glycosyl hydrolase [Nocardiopsis terrae]
MVFQKVPTRVEPGYHPVAPAPAAIPAPARAEAGESAAPEPVTVPPRTDLGPRLDGARIVMVNWRDPWQSAAGGAEEYAWRISRHLAERGAIVTFLTSREPHQARVETKDGIVIRRMGGKFTVYPRVMAWLTLWRREFHLAFDCMNGIPFFSRLVLRRRTRVVSVVHHVHDLQFNAYFCAPLAWIGRFVESAVASRVYRNCTTVTVSESSRAAMRDKLGWRAPVEIVHNGGIAPQNPGEAAPAAPVPDTAPALVSLGRLVVQKRVSRVVDLARTLSDDHPGLRVHIIGRGPEGEHLAEQVGRDGLQERVDLHGFLTEEDKNSVLASCHLHVTASEFEGWGLTVIEAARLGVPTVAYDVDGLRDSVRDGETGWLVREGETLQDVVSGALKELSDPRRAEEVRRACRAWAAHFTWEASGARMTRLVAAELGTGGSTRTPLVTTDPTAGKKAKM